MKAKLKRRILRRKRTPARSATTIGEILREDFMKPLGISVAELRASLPAWPGNSREWDDDLRWLFRDHGSHEIMVVDIALAMDRVFGCREGYFLNLWAGCAARVRGRTQRRWLSKVKPIGFDARKAQFLALGGSCPDLEDIRPPASGAKILGQLEADFPKFNTPGTSKSLKAATVKSLVDCEGVEETQYLLKSARNARRLKSAQHCFQLERRSTQKQPVKK
jgi:hypothetical protein